MSNLTITLATRGRPELLLDTLHRTVPNMVLPETTLMVAIDDDDEKTLEAIRHFPADPRVVRHIAPREDALGAKFNRALEIPATAYMVMVDYAPHLTPGFDKKILDAALLFPDNIGVVYNYMANASFPSLNVVTHGLAKRMGFVYPPYFPYWFADHWLDDIARLIDRIAFADVIADCSRKQPTQELREIEFWTSFFDLMHLARRRCAHEIISSDEFQEAPWRKEILLSHHPLIEFRSQWVNDAVRHDTRGAAGKPNGGMRYERLRAAAVERVKPEIADLQQIERNLAA